jgi:hypothetical protein
MAKPKRIRPNSCELLSKPKTDSYPEIYLGNNDAALILYIDPSPEDEGVIVATHFDSKNSNLLMNALTRIDGLSGKVKIKIVSPQANSDMVMYIQNLIHSNNFQPMITNLGIAQAITNIPVDIASEFTVQFNSRLTINRVEQKPANSSSTFHRAIQATFLGGLFMPTITKAALPTTTATSSTAIDVGISINTDSSPPKRI